MQKPLFRKEVPLKKFPGKGGWTYASLPGVVPDRKNPFGWIRVKGTIHGYPIEQYHLMPMGNGELFLPVKAVIRKKIGKKEGDNVLVELFPDNDPIKIPEELLATLKDEPRAFKIFSSYSASEQKHYIDWIYSARKEETRVQRIVTTINRVLKGLKKFDSDQQKYL